MIGVDEVGRGCLAGPLLVVAARQTGKAPAGLADSKLLSRKQRETIYQLLITNYQFGEGWVKAVEIDRCGLSGAMRLGTQRALRNLDVTNDEEIIMDGPINYLHSRYIRVKCVVDADETVPAVSAAAIYAKVRRDHFMAQLAKKYPLYSFEKHVGYATAAHMKALRELGPIERIHRQVFGPVQMLLREGKW